MTKLVSWKFVLPVELKKRIFKVAKDLSVSGAAAARIAITEFAAKHEQSKTERPA